MAQVSVLVLLVLPVCSSIIESRSGFLPKPTTRTDFTAGETCNTNSGYRCERSWVYQGEDGRGKGYHQCTNIGPSTLFFEYKSAGGWCYYKDENDKVDWDWCTERSCLTCSWKCYECGTSRYANAPPCKKWCNSNAYASASGTESCGDSADHQTGIDCTGCPEENELQATEVIAQSIPMPQGKAKGVDPKHQIIDPYDPFL